MTRKKAKGKFYYYLYVYDRFNERSMRPVYSLGTSEKAVLLLQEWLEGAKPPGDLLALGMTEKQLFKWYKTIKENIFFEPIDGCTYKEYNKNRDRATAPTKALL